MTHVRLQVSCGRSTISVVHTTLRLLHRSDLRGLTKAIVLSAFLVPMTSVAQPALDEHAQHHPQSAASGTVTSSGAALPAPAAGAAGIAPSTGAQSGCGAAMMNCMGAPGPKDFYPSLVEIPNLTPERWNEIQLRAHARMVSGLGQLSQGLGALSVAIDADDFAAMQQSLGEMRQSVRTIESGLSAHRLLAEGESPRNIALNWFKTEMNLRNTPDVRIALWWGLSTFHVVVMTTLVIFSITMILMYLSKMRRAAELLQRLTDQGLGIPVPPLAGTSGSGVVGESSSPSNAPVVDIAVPDAATTPRAWAGNLKIAGISMETPNVKTFRMSDPFGGPLPFTYKPGQFLTLIAKIDGKSVSRSYTIASSPSETTYCEFTIKREEHGVFSRYLHDQLKVGDQIEAKGPGGLFVFTGAESSAIVLIGGGVGITPLMSILRYLTATQWSGHMTLFFSFKTPDDFIFKQELERLQSGTPKLKVVAIASHAAGVTWTGSTGRISKDIIVASAPAITSSRVHLCGPKPFMDAVRIMLTELKVSKDLVKVESFGAPPAAGSQVPLGRGNTGSIISTKVLVAFSRSGKQAFLPPTLSVLEAAESVGVEIENSCRVGTCGTCKTKLLSGTVTMEVQDALTDEDRAAGLILACQAKSTGNLIVEA